LYRGIILSRKKLPGVWLTRISPPKEEATGGYVRSASPESFRTPRGDKMELSPDRQAVTQLLRQWSSGNKEALDRLMPFVYDQLRKLASNCLRAERRDHTLRATALVHEAYVRLIDSDVDWQDRVHFFAISARLLRRISRQIPQTEQAGRRISEGFP
jgi:ECF sigma factor